MPGLKSIAQELPKYGRYNDDMVAHISSDEARLLKSLGGAGTINPSTGLPEFGIFGIGGGGGILGTGINKGASDPISNALSNNPISQGVSKGFQGLAGAVDKGLVGLDKAVGNALPGGWGTIASIAGSFAGLPTPALVGLGALTGSGVMRPGRSFNLQGAIMGGALAYASSELAEYARGASDSALKGAQSATDVVAEAAKEGVKEGAPQLLNTIPPEVPLQQLAGPVSSPAMDQLANLADPGYADVIKPPASIGSNIMQGNLGTAATQIGEKIGSGISSGYDSLANFADKATSYDTYKGALDRGATNVGDTASGIKNLVMGTPGASETAAKTAKALGTTSPLTATGVAAYSGMSLMALDEQKKYLDQAKEANNISQAEYDQAVDEIERQRKYAESVVNKYPFSTKPNRDVSIGETYYPRTGEQETLYSNQPKMYNVGGSVEDPYTTDSDMNISSGNLNKGLFGLGYAAGGMPRFLSGGGDGMSDSISATIDNKQPARLADGEFVIPADVVSHLGNGSSKAGAKQLYAMMDKVRHARTGRKSQGKEINPRKFMPA